MATLEYAPQHLDQPRTTTTRVPMNLFGIPFGLLGLAGSWQVAAQVAGVPPGVGTALLVLAAAGWVVVIGLYAWRGRPATDLFDPVAAPFAAPAVIIPMVLAAKAVYPVAPALGTVLFDVFLVLTVLLGGWLTGQWIHQPVQWAQIHPGYFLPTVAGGMLGGAEAVAIGQQRLGEVMFGLGLVCWLMLGTLVLGRLFLGPKLPTPLVPTLAIEVAPAAVTSQAYLALNGHRLDVVAAGLAGYGLLMVVAQLRLIPDYARLRFMPSTWAFTFAWAAVVSVAMEWIDLTRPPGARAYEYALLAAVTVLIGSIAIRTGLAIARRQLLPRTQ
jgi:tellurite resistance protein